MTSIEQLTPADFDHFLAYLNDHLSDNGRDGTGYFQPLSRDDARFPADKADAFRAGLRIDVGAPGWRRVWVARDAAGGIAGHIDLRGHAERYAAHRCLLGMGVDRGQRKAGLGGRLIAHAQSWARESARLEWIDLQVLSSNAAAINLYLRNGFQKTGEVDGMFHIDGQRFSYTGMSKRLG
ncbi:Acetyltransferase (GNAT) family protein [Duganella sp. CF517]|uniref:GNAT family N-acetyltransferase n=1 Tax=Duganella sp. CF517 TaxID=1881038 RepID=UPI0008D8B2E5|nr:GNAT family N-acetyltransferase [Duganella sp. CF517]SEO58176.1 Acetyltransferase (GNAT) family protein [Duganella sp. CF517]